MLITPAILPTYAIIGMHSSKAMPLKASVIRLGDLLDFGQVLKAFSNN